MVCEQSYLYLRIDEIRNLQICVGRFIFHKYMNGIAAVRITYAYVDQNNDNVKFNYKCLIRWSALRIFSRISSFDKESKAMLYPRIYLPLTTF
jgi:hypothetical protein